MQLAQAEWILILLWLRRFASGWIITATIRTRFPLGKRCGREFPEARVCRMREIIWTRAAEADLQAAYEELENFQEGAGDSFLLLIDAAIELLKQFPEVAPVFHRPFRRLLLKNGFMASSTRSRTEVSFCIPLQTSARISMN